MGSMMGTWWIGSKKKAKDYRPKESFGGWNGDLENLLNKAKKDNDIQRRMAKHYAMRDKIAKAKLRRGHAKIEALTKKEEKNRLDILVKASLHASNI